MRMSNPEPTASISFPESLLEASNSWHLLSPPTLLPGVTKQVGAPDRPVSRWPWDWNWPTGSGAGVGLKLVHEVPRPRGPCGHRPVRGGD